MNVYAELWELLSPTAAWDPPGLVGVVKTASPLTVTVRGTDVTEGLLLPRGVTFRQEDQGAEVALLPCEGGLLVLTRLEGGGA